MRIVWRMGLFLVGCFLLVGIWGSAGQAYAQAGSWQEPVNISNTRYDSQSPSIAVDSSGFVHVVWCEALGAGGRCDTIYYTGYDGSTWSSPVDIVSNLGQTADNPVLIADSSGMLHMVWLGYSAQVFYSRAYAPLAGSAQNWLEPVALGSPLSQTDFPDIAMDGEGRLYVVYTVRVGDGSGVYCSQSLDGGETWSTPVAVFQNTRSDQMVDHARLAVDEEGNIHVVWTEYNFPETFPPRGIRYSRSVDGGDSWSVPLSMDGPYDLSGVIAVEREVHLVWSGTDPDRRKFYRWSADGGVTWSPPVYTLDPGGYQGWSSFALDGAGYLHLFQVASAQVPGEPDGNLYHQIRRGSDWSWPTVLLLRPEGAPTNPANVDAAVALGNEVHVVVVNQAEHPPGSGKWWRDIFYLQGSVDAPSLPPQELFVPTAVASAAATQQPAVVLETPPAGPAAQAPSAFTPAEVDSEARSFLALLVGVLGPLLLVVGVIAVYFLHRRSR